MFSIICLQLFFILPARTGQLFRNLLVDRGLCLLLKQVLVPTFPACFKVCSSCFSFSLHIPLWLTNIAFAKTTTGAFAPNTTLLWPSSPTVFWSQTLPFVPDFVAALSFCICSGCAFWKMKVMVSVCCRQLHYETSEAHSNEWKEDTIAVVL